MWASWCPRTWHNAGVAACLQRANTCATKGKRLHTNHRESRSRRFPKQLAAKGLCREPSPERGLAGGRWPSRGFCPRNRAADLCPWRGSQGPPIFVAAYTTLPASAALHEPPARGNMAATSEAERHRMARPTAKLMGRTAKLATASPAHVATTVAASTPQAPGGVLSRTTTVSSAPLRQKREGAHGDPPSGTTRVIRHLEPSSRRRRRHASRALERRACLRGT